MESDLQFNVLDVMWKPYEDTPGLEHLRLTIEPSGSVADGLVIGEWDGEPFRLRYLVRCDEQWHTRELLCEMLRLSADQTPGPALHLLADGAGQWTTAAGEPLPDLDGCLDVDIMATPFTNTLPIRRLNLPSGASQQIAVVYVALPDLKVSRMEQRYICRERQTSEGGYAGKYGYESVESGFTATLAVNEDGLVRDYPQLYAWVWP